MTAGSSRLCAGGSRSVWWFRRVQGAAIWGLLAGLVLFLEACTAADLPPLEDAAVRGAEQNPALSSPAGSQSPRAPSGAGEGAEDGASVSEDGMSGAVALPDVSASEPAAMDMSAPTSTWVVFEEVEPEESWPVLRSVRVLQADTDDKGPGYWFGYFGIPSEYELEELGVSLGEYLARNYVVDLCEAGARIGGMDAGRLAEFAARAECPEGSGDDGGAEGLVGCVVITASGAREPCPEPEPEPPPVVEGEARWLVVDE